MAGATTIPEGMEEMSDGSTPWKMRGGVLRSGFQAGWDQAPCGPHCAGEAHPAIEGWQSRPSRKPSVCLRILPWLQADHKLCLGDKLGYLEILRTHNFDLARVERALSLYNL